MLEAPNPVVPLLGPAERAPRIRVGARYTRALSSLPHRTGRPVGENVAIEASYA